MITVPASYTLGPASGRLTVRTGRTGAAAKAGHNLLIEVESWEAKLELAQDGRASSLTVSADSGSLRVVEGSGGMQALGEDDMASIKQTIDDEILKRTAVAFHSTSVTLDGERLAVTGELDLLGTRRPVAFSLAVGADGSVSGSARVKQTDWGMKPYSTLFGTLKVADEVEVAFEGHLS